MSKAPRRPGPARQPWEPHPFSKFDVYSIRALQDGKATEHQQKHLWSLLFDMSGARDLEFRPGGEDGRRASDFASGKRFVGLQLAKAVTLPSAVIDKLD